MHEMSIAESLLDIMVEKIPDQAKVTSIQIKAGPMQGIDINALQWAWQTITGSTPFEQSVLELIELPWKLYCPQCQKNWETDNFEQSCSCGSADSYPVGGDELFIDSFDVAEEIKTTP